VAETVHFLPLAGLKPLKRQLESFPVEIPPFAPGSRCANFLFVQGGIFQIRSEADAEKPLLNRFIKGSKLSIHDAASVASGSFIPMI
jgi:hypothetical protein